MAKSETLAELEEMFTDICIIFGSKNVSHAFEATFCRVQQKIKSFSCLTVTECEKTENSESSVKQLNLKKYH